MSTGSLGQGISSAVGMALGAKLKDKDYRVYTILGDGEIEEGEVWEAAMFASAKHLDNLVAIVDNNNLQIDGTLEEVNSPYPIDEKFAAFGWYVIKINGHNFDQIDRAFDEARRCKGKPTVIIAKTVKGKGVSYMEYAVEWHGKAPKEEEYLEAMSELREELAELDTAMGPLTIEGTELKLKCLSLDTGTVVVEGQVQSFSYGQPRRRGRWRS